MGKKNKREKEDKGKVQPFNITDDLLNDTVLDEFIKENFIRAGERYEEMLNGKSELDHVMIPDDMYNNIKEQIKELEKDHPKSTDANEMELLKEEKYEVEDQKLVNHVDGEELLSEEDKAALEWGRRYQEVKDDPKALKEFLENKSLSRNKKIKKKIKKKSKGFYKVAVSMGVFIGIFGISLSSKANREVLLKTMTNYFTNSSERSMNMSEDVIIDLEEDSAYKEIREKLNCHFYPIYKPDKLQFIKCLIDENSGTATIWYEYGLNSLNISVNVNREGKSSTQIENKHADNQVYTYLQDIEIDVKRLKSDRGVQMYSATFSYNDVYFEIISDLDQEIFYDFLHGIEIYST
ncbi:MAG TPA: hypothetical protein IAC41_00725 [Candidatus Merdenecus merdavium]|nr:hypothetical protein [Candidatus Merdenecus merdavium]